MLSPTVFATATTVSVSDQYIVLVAITLLFTVLALMWNKNVLLSVFAGVCWLVTSIAHFAVGSQASGLTAGLSWLFFALAVAFISSAVYVASKAMDKTDRDWYKRDDIPY